MLDVTPVVLPARSVHIIEGGRGLEVTAIRGAVWITQARDARDIVLARGRSFVLDRNGRAVVYAMSDAAIVVGPAGHITPAAGAAAEEAAWRAHGGDHRMVSPSQEQET
jgi:hypothetical protein